MPIIAFTEKKVSTCTVFAHGKMKWYGKGIHYRDDSKTFYSDIMRCKLSEIFGVKCKVRESWKVRGSSYITYWGCQNEKHKAYSISCKVEAFKLAEIKFTVSEPHCYCFGN